MITSKISEKTDRKKVLIIISEIDKALEFEWMAEGLMDDFDLQFIIINPASNPPYMQKFLYEIGIPCYILKYQSKAEIGRVVWNLYVLIRQIRPEIVHTHLLKANLLGLTAAKLARVKYRIYTRHHSSYNHIYHKNRILYDKYSNYLATDIVAISPVVKNILIEWEGVPPHKIRYIPHGLPLDKFEKVCEAEVQELARKYLTLDKWPLIGVISRFTELKGVQYIVPAFANLLKYYPNACLILANATGDYVNQINRLLLGLPEESYRTVRFEPNLTALYKLFTLFVHVPIDEHSEAFGQVYIESMAAEVPLICTISGIAHELVRHGKNAFVVPYKDSEAILNAMITLLRNPDLAMQLVKQAKEDVKVYSLDKKISLLRQLYLMPK